MSDEWGDKPDYRQPVPLSEEARKRAARKGLAEARAILSGVRDPLDLTQRPLYNPD